MFQQRTERAIAKYLRISNILFLCMIFLSIFIIISFGISFRIFKNQIVGREIAEKELFSLQKDLEKKVEERTSLLTKSTEELKKVFDESERVNNLMIDRELKMIELKSQIKQLEGSINKKK